MTADAAPEDHIVRIFVDTNVFIHLRDLKDLKWRDLFPKATQIDILVSQTVIDELDKLKTGSNERRRNRARAALKMIDAASVGDGRRLELPNKSVGLHLVIADGPLPKWEELPKLDRNRPDDQLVADVIAFGNNACLLSHDTGPRIRARNMGIQAYEPREAWLLPEERTDDQRKITQLERMLESALSDRPKILAAIGDLDAPIEKFELVVPVVPALSESARAKLVAAYFDLHPPERRDETLRTAAEALQASFLGDSPRSYNRKLDQYENDVAKYFTTLHKRVLWAGRVLPVDYVVKNDSGVAAEGLRIEMDVDNAAYLIADKEDIDRVFGPITPPELPKFERYRPPFDYTQTVNQLNRPRDPTGFYWFTRPDLGDKHGALQCADFRATRVWESDVWVFPEGRPCTVRLDVSATNLPSPVVCTASVFMEERELDWSSEIVRRLLPESIRQLLAATL